MNDHEAIGFGVFLCGWFISTLWLMTRLDRLEDRIAKLEPPK